jgi:uncharacterized protein YcfJ
VVGPPEQRCWVEQQTTGASNNAIPGAIAGAVIGGILGHQVGSGRGRDVATGVGALAGGAVGATSAAIRRSRLYARRSTLRYTQNSGRPDYYDVTYNFRGHEHRVTNDDAAGRNHRRQRNGEPRV